MPITDQQDLPGGNNDLLISLIGWVFILVVQSPSVWQRDMHSAQRKRGKKVCGGGNKCVCVCVCVCLCIVHVKPPCGWRSPSQPVSRPPRRLVSVIRSTSWKHHIHHAPVPEAGEKGRKREEERGEKERSIAPPTAIDQRSVRRAWSITPRAQPLSRWQDPNSQSQQTDEWYDKRMGPQMCLGPLISTRLVIKSADIWVAATAKRQGSGWMEAAAVEPHRSVFICCFTCGWNGDPEGPQVASGIFKFFLG